MGNVQQGSLFAAVKRAVVPIVAETDKSLYKPYNQYI